MPGLGACNHTSQTPFPVVLLLGLPVRGTNKRLKGRGRKKLLSPVWNYFLLASTSAAGCASSRDGSSSKGMTVASQKHINHQFCITIYSILLFQAFQHLCNTFSESCLKYPKWFLLNIDKFIQGYFSYLLLLIILRSENVNYIIWMPSNILWLASRSRIWSICINIPYVFENICILELLDRVFYVCLLG